MYHLSSRHPISKDLVESLLGEAGGSAKFSEFSRASLSVRPTSPTRDSVRLLRGEDEKSGKDKKSAGKSRAGRRRRRRLARRHIPRTPLGRRELVWLAVLVELALGDERFLLQRLRAEAPAARVRVAVHDDALDLGNHPVVAVRHVRGGHLRDADGDRLALGGHQDHLLVHLDVVGEAEQPRQHQLGAVADGVDGGVLEDEPLVAREEQLERLDDVPQVRLVLLSVVEVLGVEDVVHRHHVLRLAQRARARAAQLLHVPAHAQHQPQVHAERPDVRACLARHAKDAEVALIVVLDERVLVDGAHAQLPLHRGDERRPLEQRPRQLLQRTRQRARAVNRVVQPHDGNVLLAGALLRLDEAGGAVEADDQAPRHLWVQRSRVPSLLCPQDAADPRHDLVRRRVGGLVEVDDAVLEVLGEGALERSAPVRDRRIVPGPHIELIVVLQQQRPLRRVERRRAALRLDEEVVRVLRRRSGAARHLLLAVLAHSPRHDRRAGLPPAGSPRRLSAPDAA
mmetsp:Transcript_33747/g.100096  ORF Transcript_33747/g.100096 Transcript_33747/m.100096 type:complete len:511 (-) Transcript_33747:10-1542(-)